MSVIHLPKRKIIKPPTSTAIAGHVPEADEPAMETTVMEAVAIQKWLHFALKDLHFQLEQMSKDKMISARSFKESKDTAMVISSYLIGVLGDLEDRLSQTTPSPEGAA